MSLDSSIESLPINFLQLDPAYPLDFESKVKYYTLLKEIDNQITLATQAKTEFEIFLKELGAPYQQGNLATTNALLLANNVIHRSEEKIIKYSLLKKSISRILKTNEILTTQINFLDN